MTIKNLVEKAIKGGYQSKKWGTSGYAGLEKTPYLECVVLDPNFWQAVGKTENWGDKTGHCGKDAEEVINSDKPCCHFGANGYEWFVVGWKYKMQEMINFLCKGESLENYIKTL